MTRSFFRTKAGPTLGRRRRPREVANRPFYGYGWAMAARASRVIRVHVLALHECAPIVPIGMIDLLRKSIDLVATLPPPRARPRPRVDLALVAAGEERAITAAGGVALRCDTTLRRAGPCDVCVVPALDPDIIG